MKERAQKHGDEGENEEEGVSGIENASKVQRGQSKREERINISTIDRQPSNEKRARTTHLSKAFVVPSKHSTSVFVCWSMAASMRLYTLGIRSG